MTTVRLPPELEHKLTQHAAESGTSKSELIKQALENWLEGLENERDSYELGHEYFGTEGSGDGSLSVAAKARLKEKLRAHRRTH